MIQLSSVTSKFTELQSAFLHNLTLLAEKDEDIQRLSKLNEKLNGDLSTRQGIIEDVERNLAQKTREFDAIREKVNDIDRKHQEKVSSLSTKYHTKLTSSEQKHEEQVQKMNGVIHSLERQVEDLMEEIEQARYVVWFTSNSAQLWVEKPFQRKKNP